MHFGIDVSSNNAHPIDYVAVVADLRNRGGGAQPFVIVKATQGTGYVNPCFTQDVNGFRAAGAAVAAYLMDQGNNDPAAEEAAFRRVAGPIPQWNDDELPEGNAAYAQHCAQLVAENPAAGDYLNQSEEDAGFPPGAGIWEANYNGQPGVTHRPALIHQYADNGTVAGMSGPVDLNAFLGSEQQFARMFSNVTPTTVSAANQQTIAVRGDTMIFVRNSAGTIVMPWGARWIALTAGEWDSIEVAYRASGLQWVVVTDDNLFASVTA